MKYFGFFPVSVSLALSMSVLSGGCEKSADAHRPAATQPAAAEPTAVTVAPIVRQSLDRTVDFVGTLYGDEEATISAKVAGRITEIDKDIGDRVEAGGKLAQIDPTDYKLVVSQREMALREALAKLGLSKLPSDDFDPSNVATVQRAKLQADNAKARRDRGERLFRQQPPLLSEQDFADLQTAYEVAVRDFDVALLDARSQLAIARSRDSELQAARQMLSDSTVRAPSAGSEAISAATRQAEGPADRYALASRNVSVGEYVREGDAMFRLVADDPLKLRAAVPERNIGEVRVGQRVKLHVEGLGKEVEGTISRISPAVDIASRTFQVEAVIPNAQRNLRPGSFARASILVGMSENVPFVPRDAVLSFAGIDKVFSIRDGKAVEHAVELGPTRGLTVAILSDLNDAKTVAVSGLSRLSNGTPVSIARAPTTAPRGQF